MATRLLDAAFEDRIAAVRDRLAATDADAATWFGATAIEYLTGFHHIQTERPVVLAVTADQVEVTAPRLEVERVEPNPRIDAVRRYFGYPGGDPIRVAVAMLDGLDADRVATDADGAPLEPIEREAERVRAHGTLRARPVRG